MLTRFRTRKTRRDEEGTAPGTQPEAVMNAAPVLAEKDSLLLFVPTEGGLSFRLFAVQDQEAATAYLRKEFPQVGSKALLFQPLRPWMGSDRGESTEVLVVINDPSRPGVVYLSSFEDMESAESFARFEERNGLDPSLMTLHEGIPITIDAGPPTGAFSQAATQPRPAPSPLPTPVRTYVEPKPVRAAEPVRAQPATPVQAPPVAATAPTAQPVVTSSVALPRAAARPSPTAAPRTAERARQGLMEAIRRWPGWDTLAERVRGASLLDWQTYEEVKKDPIASSQARVIVATAAAAAGIGAFWAGPIGIVAYTIAGLLGWLAGAYVTYWIGTIVVPGRRSPESQELLFKALAFCHAPRLLLILGIVVPVVGPLLVIAVLLWVLAATVPAIEYALELDRQSSTLTAMSAWLALFAISFVVPALLV